MRIKDITEESLKRKESLELIAMMAKLHFESCTISNAGDTGFSIIDSSGRSVALFTTLIKPVLTLYDPSYEEISMHFGRAYEKEVMRRIKGKELLLEKDYSREKKSP